MAIENNTRWARPSHNYVPEYQQSGIPWVKTLSLPALDLVDENGDPANSGVAGTIIDNIDDYKVTFDFVTIMTQHL